MITDSDNKLYAASFSSSFYGIIDTIIICAIIVVVSWIVVVYCKSVFYDSDDDGDETTY